MEMLGIQRPEHFAHRAVGGRVSEPVRVVFRFALPEAGYGGWNEDGSRGGDEYRYGFDIRAVTSPVPATGTEARALSGAGTRIEGARRFYLDCMDLESEVARVRASRSFAGTVEFKQRESVRQANLAYAAIRQMLAIAERMLPIAQAAFPDTEVYRGYLLQGTAMLNVLRDGVGALPAIGDTVESAAAAIAAAVAVNNAVVATTVDGVVYGVRSPAEGFAVIQAPDDEFSFVIDPNYLAYVSETEKLLAANSAISVLSGSTLDWQAELMRADIEHASIIYTVHSVDEWGTFCEVIATRTA